MTSFGMDLQHADCAPCGKSELDLESVPATQVVIVDEYSVETGPSSTLDTKAPLEFDLPGSGDDFLDLSESLLRLWVQLRNADGSKLEFTKPDGSPGAQRDVGPVNLAMHSIFSQVELMLNDSLVYSSNNTYPFRAYISSALSFCEAVKNGWMRDTQGMRMETLKHDDKAGNKAMHAYCDEKINDDGVLELVGRPHVDLFNQERLIPNGVSTRLRLTRSSDAFFMMSHKNGQKPFKITILDARFMARRVKLAAKEQLRIERLISTHGAKYPVTHVVTKNFTLPMGTSSIDVDSMFTGQRPNKVVLGLVSNQAFNGAYNKSPFNFQHFNLIYACLNVDGKQVPTKGLNFDFDNQSYMDGFLALLRNCGCHQTNMDIGITGERFANGSTMLCFDLTPDLDGASAHHVSARRNGTIKASLRFKTPLVETVTLLAFGQFDNTVLIDRNRSVLYDYVG